MIQIYLIIQEASLWIANNPDKKFENESEVFKILKWMHINLLWKEQLPVTLNDLPDLKDLFDDLFKKVKIPEITKNAANLKPKLPGNSQKSNNPPDSTPSFFTFRNIVFILIILSLIVFPICFLNLETILNKLKIY